MSGTFDDLIEDDRERQFAGVHAAAAAAMLPPWEPVLAVAQLEVGHGLEPPPPPEPEPESTGGLLWAVAAAVLGFLEYVPQWGHNLVDRLVFGVTGRGEPGSHASRISHGIHRSRFAGGRILHRHTVLVATPQRLLVCATAPTRLLSSTRDDLAAAGRLELIWQVPRPEIRQARVGWHRLNPRRLRFDFTDGSWLAFPVPMARTAGPARALAGAFTAGAEGG